MASKKVYFYQVDLYETQGDNKIEYSKLKERLIEIIENKAVNNQKYLTLDLTIGNEPLHYMMDIFNYKNDTLFCRLSKQRPNNSMLQRNYETYLQEAVFDNDEALNNGIELYTYCSLEYATGIFSIVKALGAPVGSVLCSIFTKFNFDYYIKLIEIPNADGINRLYLGEDSTVTKLEFEIPLPPVEVMENVLHWNEDEITNSVLENAATAEIVIKPEYRRKLTSDTEETQKIIDYIRSKIADYSKAKVTGKAVSVKTQEYDLFAKYFSFPVDIPTYHIVDRERIDYTLEELVDIYKEHINYAFQHNRIVLKTITGR